MAFLGDLAVGFGSRLGEANTASAAEAARMDEKERSIFAMLASADDPEIASLGISGMLGLANPRKRGKGLKGFLGEMQASPILSQIQSLLQTPTTSTREAPDVAAGTTRGLPEGYFGKAALPGSSPVEAGAPPPALPPMPSRTETFQQPRRAFLSPADKAAAETEAQYTGRGRGVLAALRGAQTPEEKSVLQGAFGAPQRQFPQKDLMLEFQTPDGQMVQAAGTFDQESGVYLVNGQPVKPTKIIPTTPQRIRTERAQDAQGHWVYRDVDAVTGEVLGERPGAPPSYPPQQTPSYFTTDENGNQIPVYTPRGTTSPQAIPTAPPKAPTGQRDDAVARMAKSIVDTATANLRGTTGGGRIPTNPGELDRQIEAEAAKYLQTYPELKGLKAAELRALSLRKGTTGGGPPPGPSTAGQIDPAAVLKRMQENRRRIGGGG